ncbi:S15 peptidase family protein [Amycolatopsis taiwanensis]|uniref:S15 peptidase family protein n=1 Tax=Amycolatopsis taiwanensis TaxID=342230 RepID=UPI0004870DED|nr:CocE/NonD family hydrolase [Amycolatopsis taiwanensis]
MGRAKALLAGLLMVAAAAPATAYAADTTIGFSVTEMHFDVLVGPGGVKHCDVVGDLYLPDGASAKRPVPAILTTNGFGGSKDDRAGIGKYFAANEYAVLAYSGLGFGGSGCKITMDDPDWDGQAASQLVGFLGGQEGIAYYDAAHAQPVPALTSIVQDKVDHNGKPSTHDPRVGMIGGSYGGGAQFAAAAVDPRIDTLIPISTWNDLSYSLAPNNTDLRTGVTYRTPGVTKLTWPVLLFGVGAGLSSVTGLNNDPSRVLGCPNFTNEICPDLLASGTLGYPTNDTISLLRHASVTSFVDQIKVPVLLMQGQNDTLFNLNESIATYQALKAQGNPVKLVWQSWGHSGGPAPGEIDPDNIDPATQYEAARMVAWFNQYLKNGPVDTSPEFTYFRDWVSYNGIATPAYGSAPQYPVGTTSTLYLSGKNLVRSPADVGPGAQSFGTIPGGIPTSSSGIDVLSPNLPPDLNLPGTYASWSSAPLSSPVTVVGPPELTVRMQSPIPAALGPAGKPVVIAKIYDVAPDHTASLIHNLVAPARIADPSQPVTITLPAIVHQFAAGHSIKVVLAGGDLNYRGGLTGALVTVATGDLGQTLTLPTLD